MALIEWLRVQLDEDEAAADAFHHKFCDLNADDYVPRKTRCTCGHPAFLLAEVKAKRAHPRSLRQSRSAPGLRHQA